MNLLDFISLEELKQSITSERITFTSTEDNKIIFNFMFDVYREHWVQHAIAGKYDEKASTFRIAIGINQQLEIVHPAQKELYTVKIAKELKPFRKIMEDHIKLKIIEYLLSNTSYSSNNSFTLQDVIIKF